MSQLTDGQIDAVVQWMNTWEQLRNTAIPIRFKEDFTGRGLVSKKPPLGVMPKFIWNQKRQGELLAAISRYYDEGLKVPLEWISEFKELCVTNQQ